MCAERCHAAFTDVGEGSCASFSERVGWGLAAAAGGRDAAIMSYADGVKSTNEASNYRDLFVSRPRTVDFKYITYLQWLLALLTDEAHIRWGR